MRESKASEGEDALGEYAIESSHGTTPQVPKGASDDTKEPLHHRTSRWTRRTVATMQEMSQTARSPLSPSTTREGPGATSLNSSVSLTRSNFFVPKVCLIEACESRATHRGWCVKHYTRWRHHCDTMVRRFVEGDDARFWAKTQAMVNGCIEWIGARSEYGYGRFTVGKTEVYAHVWAWKRSGGMMGEGQHLRHLCHVRGECEGGWWCAHRACVNPRHLEVKGHPHATLLTRCAQNLQPAKMSSAPPEV